MTITRVYTYWLSYLQNTVGEMEDDGRAGPEPRPQVRQPDSLFLPLSRRAPCLQQVLAHVAAEVLEQRDLLEEGVGMGTEGVELFRQVTGDVLHRPWEQQPTVNSI